MDIEKIAVYEYEKKLMGQRYKAVLQRQIEPPARRRAGGAIIRYVVTELLKWSPKEALEAFDEELILKLYLDEVFVSMGFKYGHRQHFSLQEVFSIAFPNEIHYSPEEEAIDECNRVNRLGKYRYDPVSSVKISNNLFKNDDGNRRASACVIILY